MSDETKQKQETRLCPLKRFSPCVANHCAWWAESPVGAECAVHSIGYIDATLQYIAGAAGGNESAPPKEEAGR